MVGRHPAGTLEPGTEVRILVVGCGSAGRRHARILRDLGVANLAVCDTNHSFRQAVQQHLGISEGYADYEEALRQEFDAVFICTPPGLHVLQARLAIESGCAVFTEKPLSDRMEGVDGLLQLAKKTGRPLMMGLVLRFHKGLQRVKHLIDAGAIGRLISVRAMMGVHLPEGRRIGDYRDMYIATLPGGVTLDYLHEIDLVQWIVGRPAREVFAFAGKLSDLDMQADDTAAILIRFDQGIVAEIHLDLFQRAKRRQSEFMGTEGTLIVDLTDWDRCTVQAYRAETGRWQKQTIATGLDELFQAQDMEFLRCLATDESPALDGQEGRKSLQIALAAVASSEQGQMMRLW